LKNLHLFCAFFFVGLITWCHAPPKTSRHCPSALALPLAAAVPPPATSRSVAGDGQLRKQETKSRTARPGWGGAVQRYTGMVQMWHVKGVHRCASQHHTRDEQ